MEKCTSEIKQSEVALSAIGDSTKNGCQFLIKYCREVHCLMWSENFAFRLTLLNKYFFIFFCLYFPQNA